MARDRCNGEDGLNACQLTIFQKLSKDFHLIQRSGCEFESRCVPYGAYSSMVEH